MAGSVASLDSELLGSFETFIGSGSFHPPVHAGGFFYFWQSLESLRPDASASFSDAKVTLFTGFIFPLPLHQE